MSSKENYDEKFKKLFEEYLSDISSSENSDEYLKSEGIDPDRLISDGVRRIKQLKMRVASAKTQETFLTLSNSMMEKAKEEARKLMQIGSFDFAVFVKKEGISVSYRNLESLSEDEIREFLEKHILLKFQQQEDNNIKRS